MKQVRQIRKPEDIIAEWKSKENVQEVAILAGNRPSMRLILAWDKVTITDIYDDVDTELIKSFPEWKQVWYYKQVDYEEISDMCYIPMCKVQSHVLQAQGNHWVYPDNTVHQYALQLANGMAMRIMKNIEAGGIRK